MAASKPTVVFIPGAWHQPSSFDLVKHKLEFAGYPVVGITLPTVGAEPPNLNATDDALVVKNVLKELTDSGHDVVLVSHSYGGVVAGNSLEGFGAKQRAAAGKKGGVVMNIYISSFMVPKGLSLVDLLPNHEYLPWMRREGNYVYPDTPEQIFYADVPPALQKKSIADLKHECAAVYKSKSEYEPWHDIESSFLMTDQDQAIIPVVQENLAAQLPSGALIERVNSSHSPFLSMPDEVAAFIKKAAALGLERSKV